MDLLQNGDCAEGRYENKTGAIVSTGLHRHSCEYIKRRNEMIGPAAAFADARVPAEQRGKQTWARLFSSQMARLMREPQNGGGGR
jgi:hypothetical protein